MLLPSSSARDGHEIHNTTISDYSSALAICSIQASVLLFRSDGFTGFDNTKTHIIFTYMFRQQKHFLFKHTNFIYNEQQLIFLRLKKNRLVASNLLELGRYLFSVWVKNTRDIYSSMNPSHLLGKIISFFSSISISASCVGWLPLAVGLFFYMIYIRRSMTIVFAGFHYEI